MSDRTRAIIDRLSQECISPDGDCRSARFGVPCHACEIIEEIQSLQIALGQETAQVKKWRDKADWTRLRTKHIRDERDEYCRAVKRLQVKVHQLEKELGEYRAIEEAQLLDGLDE